MPQTEGPKSEIPQVSDMKELTIQPILESPRKLVTMQILSLQLRSELWAQKSLWFTRISDDSDIGDLWMTP